MSRVRPTLGGGIQFFYYSRIPVVSGLSKLEVPLTVCLCGPGYWVTDGAQPVPAQDWSGGSVGEHPASVGPQTLSVVLPKDSGVIVVPRQGP